MNQRSGVFLILHVAIIVIWLELLLPSLFDENSVDRISLLLCEHSRQAQFKCGIIRCVHFNVFLRDSQGVFAVLYQGLWISIFVVEGICCDKVPGAGIHIVVSISDSEDILQLL